MRQLASYLTINKEQFVWMKSFQCSETKGVPACEKQAIIFHKQFSL